MKSLRARCRQRNCLKTLNKTGSNNDGPDCSHLGRYAGQRVVVLGASGFIGRWVARGLCKAGAKLTLPVRDCSKAGSVFDSYSIEGEVYELDLENEHAVRSLFREVRPSITFNLAGYGVDSGERDEKTAYRLNVSLVQALCDVVSEIRDRAWRGLDIVHVGTAMEYGRAAGSLNEDSVPEPTTLYGRSKLAGTNVLAGCCLNYGIKGVTARLFSIYGPGESPRRLLPSLIDAARTGEKIPLTDGLHKRDFVYVEDAADALMRLGLQGEIHGEVNVATGVSTQVKDFVTTAAAILGISRESLRFGSLPTRPEEMCHEPVSIRRLLKATDWSPTIALREGIKKTASFSSSTKETKVVSATSL
jgi:UDP-glucose 4-epimerase